MTFLIFNNIFNFEFVLSLSFFDQLFSICMDIYKNLEIWFLLIITNFLIIFQAIFTYLGHIFFSNEIIISSFFLLESLIFSLFIIYIIYYIYSIFLSKISILPTDKYNLSFFSTSTSLIELKKEALSLMSITFIFLFPIFFLSYITSDISSILYLYGIEFRFDILSLSFCFLTCFIFFLCTFYLDTRIIGYTRFIYYLFFLEVLLCLAFLTTNILVFYIAFEAALIPMYFIIGEFGSRSRKLKASNYFVFYTLFGAIFMFYALWILYVEVGSFNLADFALYEFSTPKVEYILWLCLFIPFATKIPMFPLHLWLLEAHVEAPTVGSVILASILLKLGGHAMIRFLITALPKATIFFQPVIFILCAFSVIVASLSAIRQIDKKKIIAYSSIAHMNIGLFGLFTCSAEGIKGFIFLMLGHGLISAALFFLIGIGYDRTHTRLISNVSGIYNTSNLYATMFLFAIFANIGFPGTVNFISELYIIAAVARTYFLLSIFIIFSSVFTVIYSLSLFNKEMYGNFNTITIQKFYDLEVQEFYPLLILVGLIVLLGLCPDLYLRLLPEYCLQISFNYINLI